MEYLVLKTIRGRVEKGDIEIKPGKRITLPLSRAVELIREEKIKSVDAFDPDNLLVEVLQWGEDNVKGNKEVLELIDTFISGGTLRKPWGFRVKGSSKLGNYWIISDEEARKNIATWTTSFTIEELRPIVELFKIFPDAEFIERKITELARAVNV